MIFLYCRETDAATQMPSTSKEDAISSSCSSFPPEGYQATSVDALHTVCLLAYLNIVTIMFYSPASGRQKCYNCESVTITMCLLAALAFPGFSGRGTRQWGTEGVPPVGVQGAEPLLGNLVGDEAPPPKTG